MAIEFHCDNPACRNSGEDVGGTAPLGWVRVQVFAHPEPHIEQGITQPTPLDMLCCSLACVSQNVKGYPGKVNIKAGDQHGGPSPRSANPEMLPAHQRVR